MSAITYRAGKLKILLLFLLLGGMTGYADNGNNPIIHYTWLADTAAYDDLTRPGRIPVGINVSRQAYYKITDSRDDVIEAGLLNQGDNVIEIADHNFFSESRAHVYVLALKTDEEVVKKKIEIDIHVEKPEKKFPEEQKPEEPLVRKDKQEKPPEKGTYSVSLFIEDQFILKEDKSHRRKIFIEPPEGLLAENYGRPSHIDGSYPTLKTGGIPVLPLIKTLLEKTVLKKKGKEKKLFPSRQFAIKFIEKDSRGRQQLVKARLAIRMSDLD